MTASPHIIGIGSGLVAAVLFASLANNSALAVLLFYLTPLPVLLAGIGWGARTALVSCITAALVVALVLRLQTGVAFAVYIGLPGVILSYLFLLRRAVLPEGGEGALPPGGQPPVEWYPLGRIIAWATLMAGGLVALGLLLLGGDGEGYRQSVRAMFDESTVAQLQSVFGPQFGPAELDRFIDRFTRYILPAFASILWLLIMTGNLWLAAKSASISGQLTRPLPRFTQIDYPPALVAGFFAAFGLSLSSGLLSLSGIALLGAIACAFLILGVAVIHVLSAGSPYRLLLLAMLYSGLFLTPWVAPILVGVGLVEPFLQLRQRQLRRRAPPASGAGPHP